MPVVSRLLLSSCLLLDESICFVVVFGLFGLLFGSFDRRVAKIADAADGEHKHDEDNSVCNWIASPELDILHSLVCKCWRRYRCWSRQGRGECALHLDFDAPGLESGRQQIGEGAVRERVIVLQARGFVTDGSVLTR